MHILQWTWVSLHSRHFRQTETRMTVAQWLAPEWKGSNIPRHIVPELGTSYREWTAKILFCCSSITSRDVEAKKKRGEKIV